MLLVCPRLLTSPPLFNPEENAVLMPYLPVPSRPLDKCGLFAGLLIVASSATAQEALELESMIISATGTEHSQLSAPAFTTVIDAETLAQNPSLSVADVVSRGAGVTNTRDTNGRDELRMRGLAGSYTLILVDGRRVSSSKALWRGGDFDWSAVPRSSIERIEIVRGPMSSLYGADAIGGVINIITREGGSVWFGSVGAIYEHVTTGEDGGSLDLNLSTSGPVVDDVYLRLSAELYDRDAWFVDDADEVPEREEKKSGNLSGSLSWDIDDRQSLTADIAINRDERPYSNYATDSFRDQDIARETYSLTHEGEWGWGGTLLSLNVEDGRIDDFNNRYSDPQQRHLEEKNLTASGRATTELGRNTLTMGYEFRDTEVNDATAFTETGGSSATQQAIYLQDELKLSDQLSLTLGGRYDHHEDFDGEFTPRGYLVYRLNDAVSLKGGVSRAFKAPSPHQITAEYQIASCGGSCFIPGNPDLIPEISTNYEVGVEVNRPMWRLGAVVFQTDLQDMIEASFDPITEERAWFNISDATITGLEFEGSMSMGDTVSVDGAYTFLDTEQNGETELAYRPDHKIDAGVNWQFVPSSNLRVELDYNGEQQNFSDVTQSAYTLFNMSMNVQLTPDLGLRGGINNLSDLQLDNEDDDYYSNLLGRSVYLGVDYQFQ